MYISKKGSQIKPSSTLAITAKSKQMKAEGMDVIGFGAGEPDFDTPSHVKEAAIKAIKEGFTKYTPVSGTLELRKAICSQLVQEHGLVYECNQIVVSNGAKHSLTNAFMAILNPGDEVIIPAPFWLSYPEMVALADGVPKIVYTQKENQYKITSEQLNANITSRTKALIINSPSNPTGMIYTKEELKALVDIAISHDLYIISDEIYEKLVYDGAEHISVASLGPEAYEKTILINGVSKSYAMTGWRIGYAAAHPEIAKVMSNIQSHGASNPNSIAQKAALAAITGPQDCVEQMRQAFEERRDYMINRIKQIPGISAFKPQGAFYVLVDVEELIGVSYEGERINGAADFARLLLEKAQVAVVPCQDFGCPNHIRLSYAISLENIKKGIDRIESFINKLSLLSISV
ncbi:MAG: pyridoxal phosphate-dependent aminotransferase [Epulopiscium sp.]|nr:pyridoxal phosphate-dependent aminotransferase [Candidatus Epulonipiscium sp.]